MTQVKNPLLTSLMHAGVSPVYKKQLERMRFRNSPIQHIDIVNNVSDCLNSYGWNVDSQNASVDLKQQNLFSLTMISRRGYTIQECATCIAISNSLDKRFSLQGSVGLYHHNPEWLCFFNYLDASRRNTKHALVDLQDVLSDMVEQLEVETESMQAIMKRFRGNRVRNPYKLMLQAAHDGIIPASRLVGVFTSIGKLSKKARTYSNVLPCFVENMQPKKQGGKNANIFNFVGNTISLVDTFSDWHYKTGRIQD